MSMSWFSRPRTFLLGIVLIVAHAPIALAQRTAPQAGNASIVLGQLSTAFAGGQVVQSVQLSGNATWYAGSLEDSGTVSLTASTDGSSQMQLALATTGQRAESQTGAGASATCQWSGDNAVAHSVNPVNCWRPALWFLPALSLQPSLLPSYLGTVDLGSGTVGASTTVYRHLQSQLAFTGLPSTLTTQITQRSTTDLGLDPTSFLPAVLAYSVHPDNGAQISIAIQVLYSNYQTVNGVQIPFHIQRYVNGSLQLDILISSAQIN
jgi:hypothetical protein